LDLIIFARYRKRDPYAQGGAPVKKEGVWTQVANDGVDYQWKNQWKRRKFPKNGIV
jgi:hypothetical protein